MLYSKRIQEFGGHPNHLMSLSNVPLYVGSRRVMKREDSMLDSPSSI